MPTTQQPAGDAAPGRWWTEVDRNWAVVVAAFVASAVAFLGLFNFGIFLDALTREFDTGKGQVAVVFSVTTVVYYLCGMAAGRLADRYGPRPIVGAAAVLIGTGFVVGAQARSLWQLGLVWALTVGPGVGSSYSPLVAAVGSWFVRRRALALGVAMSGAGFGILAGAPLCSALLRAHGWRTSFELIGVGSAVLLGACALISSRRGGPSAVALAPMGPLLRSRTFRLLFGAVAMLSLAFFTPFVFLASYARAQGIGTATTSLIVGMVGISSTFGRLVLAGFGSRLGEVRLYQVSHGLMAVSFAVWLVAGRSAAGLFAFSILMGTGYGGFVALAPAVLAGRFGIERLGGLIGTLYSALSVGSALSPPLVGWMTDTVGAGAGIAFALVAATAAFAVTTRIGRPEPARPEPLTERV